MKRRHQGDGADNANAGIKMGAVKKQHSLLEGFAGAAIKHRYKSNCRFINTNDALKCAL